MEEDVCVYLQDLFTGCVGSDSEEDIKLLSAYRVGLLKKHRQRNQRDILIKFLSWQMKLKVLETFQSDPDCLTDNSKIMLLLDLSIITLNKRRDLKFLTTVLLQEKISYQWGFPFKSIIYHCNNSRIVFRKIQKGSWNKYGGSPMGLEGNKIMLLSRGGIAGRQRVGMSTGKIV